MGRNKRQSSRHQSGNRNQDPKRVRGQVAAIHLSPSSSPPLTPEAAPSPSIAPEAKQVPIMPTITLSPPSSSIQSSEAQDTALPLPQAPAQLTPPAAVEMEKKTPELRPAPPPTVNFWFAGKNVGGDEKPVKSPFVDDRDFPTLRTSLFTNSQSSLAGGQNRQSSVGDSEIDGAEWVSVADQTMVAEDSLPVEAVLPNSTDNMSASLVVNDDEWTFV